MLSWPVGVVIGRRMKHTSGGVPWYPVQRFVDDFPNVEPSRHARKTFFFWSVGTAVVLGYLLAKVHANTSKTINEWYNRPDLKPYPAMVDESYLDRGVTWKTMMEKLYPSYRKE